MRTSPCDTGQIFWDVLAVYTIRHMSTFERAIADLDGPPGFAAEHKSLGPLGGYREGTAGHWLRIKIRVPGKNIETSNLYLVVARCHALHNNWEPELPTIL